MANTDKKESFVFYRSFYDAIEEMPKKHQLDIYKAIACYALDNKEPTFSGVVSALWKSFRPQLDTSARRYKLARENGEKGAKYGVKGGRPRKKESEKSDDKKPLKGISEKPLNVNDNVNVNVNDNANANDNGSASQASASAFIAPTFQEVMDECRKGGYKASIASKFFMFYDRSHWRTKEGEPVRDWRALLRIWDANEAEPKKQKSKNAFNNFDQRTYNEEDLEAQLVYLGGGDHEQLQNQGNH